MQLRAKEAQYNALIEKHSEAGPVNMSIRSSAMWLTDPKLLLFTLSRHKFVAKLLSGYERVLEVGCGDAFASRLLHPEVKEMHSIDFDPVFVADAERGKQAGWPVTYAVHDMLTSPYISGGQFDAAFALDVLEHINPNEEILFIENIRKSIKPGGVFVCGTPSLESQRYASPLSREGHVNCKSADDLKRFLRVFFKSVFLFGMNDEVLHTGYFGMCHYNFALCVGVEEEPLVPA